MRKWNVRRIDENRNINKYSKQKELADGRQNINMNRRKKKDDRRRLVKSDEDENMKKKKD